jgi:hypothetical protein
MKRADLKVGEKYAFARGKWGSLYQVTIIHLRASKPARWQVEQEAAKKVNYEERRAAIQANEDVTIAQQKAALASLDQKLEQAKRDAYRVRPVEKGGQLYIEKRHATLVRNPDGTNSWKLGDPQRDLEPDGRWFERTWDEHVDLEQRRTVNSTAQGQRAAELKRRVAEEQRILTEALAKLGVNVDSYYEGVEFDRGYRTFDRSEVGMERATLARILGVDLPVWEDEEEES